MDHAARAVSRPPRDGLSVPVGRLHVGATDRGLRAQLCRSRHADRLLPATRCLHCHAERCTDTRGGRQEPADDRGPGDGGRCLPDGMGHQPVRTLCRPPDHRGRRHDLQRDPHQDGDRLVHRPGHRARAVRDAGGMAGRHSARTAGAWPGRRCLRVALVDAHRGAGGLGGAGAHRSVLQGAAIARQQRQCVAVAGSAVARVRPHQPRRHSLGALQRVADRRGELCAGCAGHGRP